MSQIITGISDYPNPIVPVTLPDGTTLTLTLYWRPQQSGWFYDLAWDGQTPTWLNHGMRLVAGPNVLRQYKNQLTFGLQVSTSDGLDPNGQEDFADGTCTLTLLDDQEVVTAEAVYFPGN